MRKKSKNLESRIVNPKVMRFTPIKDSEGRYIPYCDFGYHQGISKRWEVCEKRKCTHYRKLYIK